jgi:hypothetical protein
MPAVAANLSIRDRIRLLQAQAITGAITPQQVRENLMLLTGLFGSVLDEHREADAAYMRVVIRYIELGDPVNKAELRASISPEYARAREAKDTERLVLEILRGCKRYLESLDTEMRLS